MLYRREVDGLRALAVIPVILFHAGFQGISGGFVGVDVFFVISGYLITAIICAELESGNFSVIKFYERRVRRIFPALIFVIFACIILAWMWLLPSDMMRFSQSLSSVSLFASNIFFWSESGYFDSAAELKPLLHTWSLSVEEQYYVVFPLFLMLAWGKGKRAVISILVIMALGSLLTSQWWAQSEPVAAFYLLPTRAWEFAMGAFVAFYLSNPMKPYLSIYLNEYLGTLGLFLILYAILKYNENTPYPGFYTLVPTVGAALILLFSTPQTFVGKLLGNRLFVGIGLVSYSAYLWHYPLFAFARHRGIGQPGMSTFVILSLLAVVLAYLTWRFIEKPFRNRKLVTRSNIFLLFSYGTLLIFAFGLLGYFTQGLFFRAELKEKISNLEFRLRINQGLGEACDGFINPTEECRTDENPEVILWGDSYAMHLMQGLQSANPGLKIIQFTQSGCGPILDIAPVTRELSTEWAKLCLENNDKILKYIKNQKGIRYVVLSSPFAQYVDSGARILLRNGEVIDGESVSYEYFINTLNQFVSLGIKPIIISPTPQNGNDIGKCLLKAAMLDRSLDLCDFRLEEVYDKYNKIVDFLDRVDMDFEVRWLIGSLCEGGVCRVTYGDTFIYRDNGHLSHEGSKYLGENTNLLDLI
jgi:peptidoglycan/LPS O-acetylase OafA/YrhL